MDRARLLDLIARGYQSEGHGAETAAALAECSLQEYLRNVGLTLPPAVMCRCCGSTDQTAREVGRV